ncbi:MAG: hypothetical protein D6805_02735 [Planctomycetota bacterium]|nr:MAG: hypothetical protein D6805_02735 [Planctomycetota bacterium]
MEKDNFIFLFFLKKVQRAVGLGKILVGLVKYCRGFLIFLNERTVFFVFRQTRDFGLWLEWGEERGKVCV